MNVAEEAAVRRIRAITDLLERTNAQEAFSFCRMITAMGMERGLDGRELEVLQEYSKIQGKIFHAHRPQVPFELLLQRELVSSATPGNLVETVTAEAQAALRPASVVAGLGVNVIAGLHGNFQMPVTKTRIGGTWLTDAGTLTGTGPELTLPAVTPKTAGAMITVSRKLTVQSSAEPYLRQELTNCLGLAADHAVLGGSGTLGEPLGLVNTSGINTVAGGSFAYASALSMKRKISDGNAPEEGCGFVALPAVRETLEARERAAGSGFIWDDNKMAGLPARASTYAPTATVIAAHWPSVNLLIWGDGFEIEANPYESSVFAMGAIRLRAMLSCDVIASHLLTVCVAQEVT